MKMSKTESLISRADSEAIKGLLMLFIVMGHVRGVSYVFQSYIYCFHVQCYFILPFLYPSKPLTKASVADLAVKLLWPFLLLFGFQTALTLCVFHDSYFTSGEELIPGIGNGLLGAWSIVCGGVDLINKFCGTQFLWFLPAFFSMSVIRMWYSHRRFSTLQKTLIFIPGLACYIIYFVLMWGPPFLPAEFFYISQAVSPLSVWQGLGFFTLGIVVARLAGRFKSGNGIGWWAIVAFLTILYIPFYEEQSVFRVIKFLLPAAVFLALYGVRSALGRAGMLRQIGKRSLAIYLIHPFLCIVLSLLVPISVSSNPIVYIAEVVAVLIASYALAVLIDKVPLLRKILFPRGEEIGFLRKINWQKA